MSGGSLWDHWGGWGHWEGSVGGRLEDGDAGPARKTGGSGGSQGCGGPVEGLGGPEVEGTLQRGWAGSWGDQESQLPLTPASQWFGARDRWSSCMARGGHARPGTT